MKFRRQNREEVSINLTPLIDVVFLLLIFFMVSIAFQAVGRVKRSVDNQKRHSL